MRWRKPSSSTATSRPAASVNILIRSRKVARSTRASQGGGLLEHRPRSRQRVVVAHEAAGGCYAQWMSSPTPAIRSGPTPMARSASIRRETAFSRRDSSSSSSASQAAETGCPRPCKVGNTRAKSVSPCPQSLDVRVRHVRLDAMLFAWLGNIATTKLEQYRVSQVDWTSIEYATVRDDDLLTGVINAQAHVAFGEALGDQRLKVGNNSSVNMFSYAFPGAPRPVASAQLPR